MSDDVSNKSGGGVLLRVGMLLLLMAVLLSLLAWQRHTTQQAEVTSARTREAMLKDAQARHPPKPPSPYGVPDFLGEPEFDLLGNVETLSEASRKTVRAAWPQIARFRKATGQENSTAYGAIPAGEQSRTQRQCDDEYVTYRLRELDAYRSLTKDTGEAKVAGERFLDAYFRASGDGPDARESVVIRELAQEALAAGSRDPLVRIYAAQVEFDDNGDGAAADVIWLECLQQLSASRYPRITSVVARHMLYDSAKLARGTNALERAVPLIVSIVRWLEEEGQSPQWRGCTFSHLRKLWERFPNVRPRLLAACFQSSRIDPYHLHVLAGYYHQERGWRIRGGGFAGEVKESSWEPFFQHLSMSAEHFEYAWLLDPSLPYAPVEMIGVSNVGQNIDDEPLDWFLRTVSARLDYYRAYSKYDLTLTSRWGGGIDQMARFGQQCLATNRFDTHVPYYLLQTLRSIQTWELDDAAHLPDVVDLNLLLRDFLRRRNEFRDRHPKITLFGDSSNYRTRLVRLLELGDLPSEAAAEVSDLDLPLDLPFLQANGRLGVYKLRRLQAAQGELRSRVLTFDQNLRRPWSPERSVADAESLARELDSLRSESSAEAAKPYFRHAEQIVGQLAKFSAGNWAELTVDHSGAGWEIHSETWETRPESNEIRMSRRRNGTHQSWARPLAGFRPPFELELELNAAESPHYPTAFGVKWQGPYIKVEGKPEVGRTFVEFKMLRMANGAPRHERVRFVDGELNYRQSEKLNESPHRKTRIRVWDHAYECLVDNAWESITFQEPLDPAGSLMFGEIFPWDVIGGELRLANVRVRRLDMPPPPGSDVDREQRADYWRHRVEVDAGDLIAAMRLGEIYLEEGHLVESLELAENVIARSADFAWAVGLKGRALFRLHRYAEARPLLQDSLHNRDDYSAMAALLELRLAGPAEHRMAPASQRSLANVMKGGVILNPVVVLAAQAVDHAASGDFNAARDRNREAIAKATEPLKSELEARQKLYEADQTFELPPAARTPIQ